jgi:putative spermidine/putrescine transport system permease protein
VVAVRTESLTWRVVRVLSLVGFGIFFLVPLLSMVDFSTRVLNGDGRTLTPWANLFRDEMLRTSIISSLLLALLTTLLMLVLLVPTMIWVRLRVPSASKLVEYLCLLPLTIPPLVIVVGIANVYAWVSYLFGNSPLTLTFAYVILVLPYAYRAIDAGLAAIDLKTLAEAARNLGASWATVLLRIVVPNIRSALVGAAFLAVALVLGEFTIASLLNYDNMQVAINEVGKRDAQLSVAV